MKLDWGNPITWMIAGVVIILIGLAIAGFDGDSGAGNPVAIVGFAFLALGAITWAIRRGASRERDR